MRAYGLPDEKIDVFAGCDGARRDRCGAAPLIVGHLRYSVRSASRFFQRIFSFSSGVIVVRLCSHATGDGCHGTNGQSLPMTTRSMPTSSIRKRNAFSLPTTVS